MICHEDEDGRCSGAIEVFILTPLRGSATTQASDSRHQQSGNDNPADGKHRFSRRKYPG